jgi:hypothetical protein
MLFNSTNRLFSVLAGGALLLLQVNSAFAQDQPLLPSKAPSVEVMSTPDEVDEPASATLQVDATVATSAVELHDVQQESAKLMPTGQESGEDDNGKRFLYLPLINGGGQGAATEAVDAAAVNASWRTIKYETFEGSFPNSKWQTYDCNGSANGNYFWDDESYKPYQGGWSAWVAGNVFNPAQYYYPNNACSWMIYGPFSLSSAQSARMTFRIWSATERSHDYIGWYVSCDGNNFLGYRDSGYTFTWLSKTLDLSGCLHDSSVWVGFLFTSDKAVGIDGAFVDNVRIEEYR